MNDKTLGQIAFEEYFNGVQFSWGDKVTDKDRWEAAAQAVASECGQRAYAKMQRKKPEVSHQLTKREKFAMVAMHGLLSNGDYLMIECVEDAIEHADTLIKELDKKQE
jgi:hypothetical protein